MLVRMELVIYALAAIGALALLLVAGFAAVAALSGPEEPPHVDPDLLVEMPAQPRVRHQSGSDAMLGLLFALAALSALTAPSAAAENAQQQRMTDCNAQAAGMTGTARQTFMSSCLKGEHPRCTPGKSKPCGNSCIALDKVCHK